MWLDLKNNYQLIYFTMKKKHYISLLLIFCFISFAVKAQEIQQVTPYEKLPSSQVDLKPTYDDDLPQWAKMLYQYPINMRDIDREYRIWEKAELKRTGLPKIKTPLVRYYKIWRKSLIQYVDVDGKINLPDTEKLYKELIRSQEASYLEAQGIQKAPQSSNNSNWTFLGPKNTYYLNGGDGHTAAAPWQVNIYSFDVAPSNHDILYVGTETGYVNKTVDKGETWTLCSPNYHFGGGVTSVAIHPTNPDIVYVGAGGTIHKTTDGGNSWKRTNISVGANRLKIDYTNPEKIYAATGKGVHITKDGGEKWKRKTGNSTWDIEIKPNDPNIIYAVSVDGQNKFKILRSNNGGDNWSFDNTFTADLTQNSGALLAVTPANPDLLYAVFLAKNGNCPYLYKGVADTGGSFTWNMQFKGEDASFTSDKFTNGQGYYDMVLEVAPDNENILFVGTTTLFKSSNGGKTLYAKGGYAGSFSIHPDIQDIKILDGKKMWIATDGGMNYSKDWLTYKSRYSSRNEGLIGSDFWGFDQGWNEDICVGGRYHNGNTAIADFYGDRALRLGGGESATGWVIQGKSRHVVFDDLGSGMILPKTVTGTLEGRFPFTPKQGDGGKHPNMDSYGASRSNLYTHPYYFSTIYSGSGNAIWISHDYGATFDMLKDFGGRIKYFNSSFANPDVMYVDVADKGFYRSEDGGKTWTKKTKPTSWNARLSFVISPYDANVVYAGYQDGKGVYRSEDGGQSWIRWSGQISTKSLVIQPTIDGKDLVYAFASRGNVYMKKDGDTNWTEFNNNYPKGMLVNIALPFYRDAKLRVAGNAGVWESPLAEEDFAPLVTPWVEKKVYDYVEDTIQFNCHSMLKHAGATWTWSFSETPSYIDDVNSRVPKVLFANPGKYDVTLTITQNGKTYSRTVKDMIEVKGSPTVDCDNPGVIPYQRMKLIGVDSAEPGSEGVKAFDGNNVTLWHTKWSSGVTRPPHYIAIDLGKQYKLSAMHYLTRTDGPTNGTIKKYKLYISNDKSNWGTPVKEGEFTVKEGMNDVDFPETVGRYVKLVALSEIDNKAWTSVAELSFTGCDNTSGLFNLETYSLKAFPIPTNNVINISLPFNNGGNTFEYYVISATGQQLDRGETLPNSDKLSINVNQYPTGNYFVVMRSETGTLYRVKFIKE